MKTYKIKSQKDLEKFKDEYGYYINGNAEFEYSAEFPGRLLVGGYLYIGAGSYIEAGGYIKAGESIEAGSSIEAGGYIEAGGSIEAGESIEAGTFSGITAGLQITCKGTLSFGLKAYAGICAWRAISDEEKIITCSKLVGGGVVEYGILRETGEVIENDVTEEAIKLLKDKGYKIVKETK
jgi:UDP-3-O-[3-hydroxymyristoyl] glucosamine N-acyltransferase